MILNGIQRYSIPWKKCDQNWHQLMGKPHFFILIKRKQYRGNSGRMGTVWNLTHEPYWEKVMEHIHHFHLSSFLVAWQDLNMSFCLRVQKLNNIACDATFYVHNWLWLLFSFYYLFWYEAKMMYIDQKPFNIPNTSLKAANTNKTIVRDVQHIRQRTSLVRLGLVYAWK